jgi:rare lipoprotein A
MAKEQKMTGVSKLLIVLAFLFTMCWAGPASAYCEWPCFENKTETSSTSKKKPKKTASPTTKKQSASFPSISSIVSAVQTGIASFYWQPQPVACGGRFDPEAMTAAHKTLKCGSKVTVTNQRNGKSVVVTINDRGPFIKGRVIDLSKAAARKLDMISSGIVPVKVEVRG